jgi:hypothetical protein
LFKKTILSSKINGSNTCTARFLAFQNISNKVQGVVMLFARGACRSPISSEEEETFEKENAELQKTRRKSVKRIKTHQPTSKIIKVSEQKVCVILLLQ